MISDELQHWLQLHADALDSGELAATDLLPRLAADGLFAIGVPKVHGGKGGSTSEAVLAIAAVTRESLTAAFTAWGHRTFIEYLLQSPNAPLRERLLPDLLAGRVAGATGLSNAMKHLCGIESLQVKANADGKNWVLDGRLPWVTNLQPDNFIFAVAVNDTSSNSDRIFAVPHYADGVGRSQDLRLISLQSSNTAALSLQGVKLDSTWLIDANARQFLPAVRPAFLGLQCGMSIGLAQRALDEAERGIAANRHVLRQPLDEVRNQLEHHAADLLQGVESQHFIQHPERLFEIRIALAEAVQTAVQLELQATGGSAYLIPQNGFARRLRESAFIPVVTPSVVQLRAELAKRQQAALAA